MAFGPDPLAYLHLAGVPWPLADFSNFGLAPVSLPLVEELSLVVPFAFEAEFAEAAVWLLPEAVQEEDWQLLSVPTLLLAVALVFPQVLSLSLLDTGLVGFPQLACFEDHLETVDIDLALVLLADLLECGVDLLFVVLEVEPGGFVQVAELDIEYLAFV